MTLDLNGHVLKYESANNGSVIVVEGSGNLTLTDSNTTAKHKFNPNGKLWVLDDASGYGYKSISAAQKGYGYKCRNLTKYGEVKHSSKPKTNIPVSQSRQLSFGDF